MRDYFKAFRDVARGTPLRTVLTIEWVIAVQESLKALAQGRNITVRDGLIVQNGDSSVRIGLRSKKVRGGGFTAKPLQIVASRPAYIPQPVSAPATGNKRFYITWGTVNGVVADNWDDHFDFSPTPDGGRFFFAKATFAASASLKVASWEILTGSSYDAYETPEWEAGGVRPDYYIFSLGAVYVYTPEATEEVPSPVPVWSINPTPGSVMITEHVTNIGGTGAAGEFILTKQLSHYLI